jgi:formamidopyrimidine-DNA glycosylase
MSEGPEVKITAEKICKAICGKAIDKVYCKPNANSEFAQKIIGSNVKAIETYGKNMVIVFSNGMYLRNHILMWGKWRIYNRQEFEEGKSKPPPRHILRSKMSMPTISTIGNIVNNPKCDSDLTEYEQVTRNIQGAKDTNNEFAIEVRNDSRVRLVIYTKDKVAVQFNGPILKFSFENPANAEPITKLGPDPLRSDFDINDLKKRLSQRINNNGTVMIADLMLDQTVVAGIGNKYKSEILFLSKINPFVYINDIPPKAIKKLLQQIASVLNIGYINAGMTRRVHKTMNNVDSKDNGNNNNNNRWSDKHWVFRRGGRPCWKCETTIITDQKTSSRVTYWCPKCQQ